MASATIEGKTSDISCRRINVAGPSLVRQVGPILFGVQVEGAKIHLHIRLVEHFKSFPIFMTSHLK